MLRVAYWDDSIQSAKDDPCIVDAMTDWTIRQIKALPSAQTEIIHCKDCKYYSSMNKETKTGICNLIMHQNFGDDWFCAGAERKIDDGD